MILIELARYIEFKVLRIIKVDYHMFIHRYLIVEDMEERVQSLSL